jgi:hypothetical protein
MQWRWGRMLMATIHMILFQPGDIKYIWHSHLRWGVQFESIGTDGFSDANWPAKRELKLEEITICRLRYTMICIANWKDLCVELIRISLFEILLAACYISFHNYPCWGNLPLLSNDVET